MVFFPWILGSLLVGIYCPSALSAAGLMDVYDLANQNDPQLQSIYFQTQAIKEGRRQAIARLLPTIAGSAGYSQTDQDIKSSDNTVFGVGKTDFNTTTYGLSLSQPVFRWDLFVGLWQSKAENLRAEAELVVAQQDLMVRVADLYLQALAAKDRLDCARVEQAAVAKHLELAKGRQEMGLIPITDLHDAMARMAITQAETIQAQNALDDALQALAEVTGEPIEKLMNLQDEITLASPEPADSEEWVKGALERNPSIQLQKKAVEVARYEVKRQRAGHYPSVDLVGSFGNEETEGSLFGGGSEVETTEIGVQLNVPIFQGGLINSKVRQAAHQLSSVRQELKRQERAVARDARSAYLGVYTALSRIDALQQSVVSNRLALEAKKEGFMSGLYTSLNVLDAERDLSLVILDFAQARYEYILNSLKLKRSVGSLSVDDLTAVDRWFSVQ
ncbi:MAG: TolC family outer membrane protein [Desulfuromonadaceae bacterium]|nr:TolC family outer membrane protein [Desulfuromonadaceae bacterium]